MSNTYPPIHTSGDIVAMTAQQEAIQLIQFVYTLRLEYCTMKDQLMTPEEIPTLTHIHTRLS